jgi:hypothetical protein
MKPRSSITLPPEGRVVCRSKARLNAKSIVEGVRRGLRRLREATEREALPEAYCRASQATHASVARELDELDHLSAEGLSDP